MRVVGESFEKLIFDSPKDSLVLVHHPISHKNRGLKDKWEKFAEVNENKNILIGRYSGINESDVFKTPKKLPAIVYFKTVKDENGQMVKE